MKLKIKDKKAKPFQGDDGETLEYFWYKAERSEDQVVIRFGSMNGAYEAGKEYDLPNVEKYEMEDGRIGYKEVSGG